MHLDLTRRERRRHAALGRDVHLDLGETLDLAAIGAHEVRVLALSVGPLTLEPPDMVHVEASQQASAGEIVEVAEHGRAIDTTPQQVAKLGVRDRGIGLEDSGEHCDAASRRAETGAADGIAEILIGRTSTRHGLNLAHRFGQGNALGARHLIFAIEVQLQLVCS